MICALPLAAQSPAPLKTSITVVEKLEAEAPANISLLEAPRLAQTPGVNLDDRLRDVPGFSLFRRSSSLVAHPTTQGVSLRGIGSSGASRTLVLWDGVPANDPFGGWVYWTRFPVQEMGRAELSRGASTSVFGDRALGGAIGLFTRAPERRRLHGGYEGGQRNAHDVWAGFSNVWYRWSLSGWGRGFSSDGYYLTPAEYRGAVDRKAAVRFATGGARWDYFQGQHQLFLKASLLAEQRKNGTALQNNSTGLGEVAAHYTWRGLSLGGYHTREEFRSSFSAIGAGRNSERLTFLQSVPAEAEGGAGLWLLRRAGWNFLAGGDVHRVEGHSIDSLVPSGQRVGGGEVVQGGVFTQADRGLGPARVYLGARESWTGRGNQFLSPSAGLALGRGRWRARASAYRAFRAPTLNELFREFRVGNAVTQANSALRPERLWGVEAGADWVGEAGGARLTLYRNSLADLITNVTLPSPPGQILRQRRNAEAAVSRGAEVEWRGRWRHWRAEAGYLFVDSRFAAGARVPQIPRHQGSAQLTFEHGGTLAAAGFRSYAAQFEDDANRFLLAGYSTVQLMVRQRLGRGLAAVASFENLFDREYLAGFSPTPILGAPRLWRAGLRWEGRLR